MISVTTGANHKVRQACTPVAARTFGSYISAMYGAPDVVQCPRTHC